MQNNFKNFIIKLLIVIVAYIHLIGCCIIGIVYLVKWSLYDDLGNYYGLLFYSAVISTASLIFYIHNEIKYKLSIVYKKIKELFD